MTICRATCSCGQLNLISAPCAIRASSPTASSFNSFLVTNY